jgi:hypothetical protein
MTNNSEFNTGIATDGGDIDRNLHEGLEAAEGILGRFVETDTLRQREAINFSALVASKAAQSGLDTSDEGDMLLLVRKIQGVLKERAVNELTRLDRVVLDLDGEHGRQSWMATDVPAIVFCAVKSSDSSLQSLADDKTSKVRALALYFDPKLAGTRDFQHRDGTFGTKPNIYAPDAYTSIVGTYTSVADAEAARDELRNAVNTVAGPVTDTALNADPVRNAISGTTSVKALDSL